MNKLSEGKIIHVDSVLKNIKNHSIYSILLLIRVSILDNDNNRVHQAKEIAQNTILSGAMEDNFLTKIFDITLGDDISIGEKELLLGNSENFFPGLSNHIMTDYWYCFLQLVVGTKLHNQNPKLAGRLLENANLYFERNQCLLELSIGNLWLATTKRNTGDYKDAIDILRYSLQAIDKSFSWYWLIKNNLAIVYIWQGDLAEAYRLFQEILDERESMTYVNDYLAITKWGLGYIFYLKGDFYGALSWTMESLSLREQLGNSFDISISLTSIGLIYQKLGKNDKALDYFEKSYNLRKNINSQLFLAEIIFRISFLAYSNNWNELFNKYSNLFLQKITISGEVPFIYDMAKLVRALIHLNANTFEDRVAAKKLIENISINDRTFFEFLFIVKFQLVKVKFDELRLGFNKALITEITNLADEILSIGNRINSPQLIIEAKLIQVRLKLMLNEYKEAFSVLNVIQSLVRQNNLYHMVQAITIMEQKLKQLTDDNVSLSSNLDDLNLLTLDRILIDYYGSDSSRNEVEESIMISIFTIRKKEIFSKIMSNWFVNSNSIKQEIFSHVITTAKKSKSKDLVNTKCGSYEVVYQEINEIIYCYAYIGEQIIVENKFDNFITTILQMGPNKLLNNQEILDKLVGIFFTQKTDDFDWSPQYQLDPQFSNSFQKLQNIKFYFHPIRIGILRLLFQYNRIVSADLRKMLGATWGSYTQHLVKLEEREIIFTKDEFIDEKLMKVVYPTSSGLKLYHELSKTLKYVL